VSAAFLIFYGLFRFLVEYVREPDGHLGFVAFDFLTMGQLLSLPMIVIGLLLFYYAQRGTFVREPQQ
jgi:phosphatidylglycerol:prolipoprotein diacylglycerol transferase